MTATETITQPTETTLVCAAIGYAGASDPFIHQPLAEVLERATQKQRQLNEYESREVYYGSHRDSRIEIGEFKLNPIRGNMKAEIRLSYVCFGKRFETDFGFIETSAKP